MLLAPTPTYGSDRSGFICGYRFTEGTGRPIAADEAAQRALRSAEGADDSFVWLHFDLTAAAAEKWMATHLALPPAFFEALHHGTRSTQIEEADGSLVAVVNDVLFDFEFDATQIATLWACASERVLITARRKPLRSIDRLRHRVRAGHAFRSALELLVRLFRDQADVLAGIVREGTAKVDAIEDSLLADRLDARRAKLGNLRRVLVRVRRLLAPEPASIFRLLNHPPRWTPDADLRDLRQATEEFSAALSELSGLLERIKLLQEEVAAQVGEQNNRSLFLLTVFTVLALPINIVAGLFGMNVGGVPLSQNDGGFWIVVGIVTAFTLAGLWVVFRRRRD